MLTFEEVARNNTSNYNVFNRPGSFCSRSQLKRLPSEVPRLADARLDVLLHRRPALPGLWRVAVQALEAAPVPGFPVMLKKSLSQCRTTG